MQSDEDFTNSPWQELGGYVCIQGIRSGEEQNLRLNILAFDEKSLFSTSTTGYAYIISIYDIYLIRAEVTGGGAGFSTLSY